jgi:hypothetical protein
MAFASLASCRQVGHGHRVERLDLFGVVGGAVTRVVEDDLLKHASRDNVAVL